MTVITFLAIFVTLGIKFFFFLTFPIAAGWFTGLESNTHLDDFTFTSISISMSL